MICKPLSESQRVAVPVAWFGTDLRAGMMRGAARRRDTGKTTHAGELVRPGIDRAALNLVSQIGVGRPRQHAGRQ